MKDNVSNLHKVYISTSFKCFIVTQPIFTKFTSVKNRTPMSYFIHFMYVLCKCSITTFHFFIFVRLIFYVKYLFLIIVLPYLCDGNLFPSKIDLYIYSYMYDFILLIFHINQTSKKCSYSMIKIN